MVMDLEGGEEGRSLCKFCSCICKFVGLDTVPRSLRIAERPIWEIQKELGCSLCRVVAKFYNEWSGGKFDGLHVPDERNHAILMHDSILGGIIWDDSANSDFQWDYPAFYRIMVEFRVSTFDRVRPILQFQLCSQPLRTLEDFCDGVSPYSDWGIRPEEAYCSRTRPLFAETQLFCKSKETCRTIHGDSCNNILPGNLPSGLRLLDVKKRCVILDDVDASSYVALSYVWGEHQLKEHGKQMPKLTEFTEEAFRKPKSLTREKVL